MNINPLPEYTEEVPLGYLKPEQFFAIARQAVQELRWQIVSELDNELICHTPGGGESYGESITIKIGDTTATLHSKSVNEYYWVDDQNRINAEQFKQAVLAVIEKNRQIDKKLKLFTQEKFGALVPSKTYLITPILIYLNILVFICMVVRGISPITPDTQSLLRWGGNFRPLAKNGEWWRLLTYMFLHGGILHLVMNAYALLYIGMFLEPLLGRFRFASAYIMTGICGGLMSIIIHPFTVGVGASGAIFGLYGIFLAMLTTDYIERTARNTLLKNILFFVLYNLLFGLKGNIDNAAHIGGLLSGIIIGYIYYPGIKHDKPFKQQAGITSLIMLATVLVSATVLRVVPDDSAAFEMKMKAFAEMESMALEVYKMNASASKEDVLYNIKDRGIYYWNEDIKILNEINDLSLPQSLRDRNAVLLYYCRRRIDQYDLMYKKISEQTNKYDNKIQEYTNEIDQIIVRVKNM